MATRKRTIQPSIWQDPDFGTLDPLAQLIFIGCITQADDEGRLNGHPAIVKSMIFPYEQVSLEQVIDSLTEIASKMSNFVYYQVDSQYYIMFKNWLVHQTLREDRSVKSIYPQPKKDIMTTECQADDGQLPAEVKLSKGKRSKVSNDTNFQNFKNTSVKTIDDVRKILMEKGIIKSNKLPI